MTNVEDRVSRFKNGICPDCGSKLEKTKYEDDQEPIVYCTRCLVSFELCGGQVMSEGNLKQRVNEKWRSFREATGDGMHEISVGIWSDRHIDEKLIGSVCSFRFMIHHTVTDKKHWYLTCPNDRQNVLNWYRLNSVDIEDAKREAGKLLYNCFINLNQEDTKGEL